MAGKKKDSKELAAALNSLELNKEYTLDDLKTNLGCGSYIASTIASNFLANITKGRYVRISDEPVHYRKIETALEGLRKRLKDNKRLKKLELTEENCVRFLKEKGYRILQPTFQEI